jgi:hypothetical protein
MCLSSLADADRWAAKNADMSAGEKSLTCGRGHGAPFDILGPAGAGGGDRSIEIFHSKLISAQADPRNKVPGPESGAGAADLGHVPAVEDADDELHHACARDAHRKFTVENWCVVTISHHKSAHKTYPRPADRIYDP